MHESRNLETAPYADYVWTGEYPVKIQNGTTGEMEDHTGVIMLQFLNGGIAPAFDYYSKHGDPTDKMAARFYYGIIHQNRKEDDRALYYYSIALEDSSAVNDNRLKELVNSAISEVYSRSHNSPQELKYALDALKYGRMAGDSRGIWSITGHLAACYANMYMWEDAKSFI